MDAWRTGTRSVGATNIVRRMASIRSSVRSSYRAFSTASGTAPGLRAATDRNTVAGSVACSTTIERTMSRTSSVLAWAESRWRSASRARRSATVIERMNE